MQPFHQLENPVQPYAWGSIDGISSFTGIANPNGTPMAELWMGAHPANPSMTFDGVERISLDALIAAQPDSCLGQNAICRFGSELPFLFKVLSAAGPLSLQVHPARDQALIGFERENREMIPLSDPKRNYRDSNPKREILMALSPFRALCGFRESGESIRLLKSISCPELEEYIGMLSVTGSHPGYIAFYRALLELDAKSQHAIIATATEKAQEIASAQPASPHAKAYELLLTLSEAYPTDIGVLCPLYLNIVDLVPGEAMCIPSGIIHSYVRGTGIELMTNSDNTLRCGLTPKHRNVPELYAILEDIPYLPDILGPDDDSDVFRYPAPFPEFELVRLNGHDDESEGTVSLRTGQPAIMLGISGHLRFYANGDSIEVAKGTSCFIPASITSIEFAGKGTAYMATVPGE